MRQQCVMRSHHMLVLCSLHPPTSALLVRNKSRNGRVRQDMPMHNLGIQNVYLLQTDARNDVLKCINNRRSGALLMQE